jgi:hypothetical protein
MWSVVSKKGVAMARFYEQYAGVDMRRAQERADGGMLSEDKSAPSNLPQNVVYRPFPDVSGSLPGSIDDGLSGVDSQIREDRSGMMRNYKPKKI